ncbi:hypothetical protein KXD40_006248 [Peronospora effusa]|nr:hypothetical protein KXD40_006248 [Peronospora effusa]
MTKTRHYLEKKALSMIMCMKFCTMTSIILRIKSCLYQAPTPVTSEFDDVSSDADDEWGIIHYPNVQRTGCQSSHLRMETTFRNVQVSLVIVVAMSSHVPRLQRTRAKWTFNAIRPYSPIKFCFVQEPMFDVGFLTSSHFDAYVSDRLDFAARRYSEWVIGSRPRCAPSIVHTTMSPVPVQPSPRTCTTTPNKLKKTAKLPKPKQLKHPDELSTQQVPLKTSKPQNEDVHHHTKKKQINRMVKRMQPVKSRYMDYKHSATFLSRRLENQTRRHALQSSRHGP